MNWGTHFGGEQGPTKIGYKGIIDEVAASSMCLAKQFLVF